MRFEASEGVAGYRYDGMKACHNMQFDGYPKRQKATTATKNIFI